MHNNDDFFVVNNLYAKCGNFILNNICFNIPEGKILAILGESGSGKTLLLKTLSGLLKNTNGEIFLNKNKIDNLPTRKRGIGFISNESQLYPHLNVKKSLLFPAIFYKNKRKSMTFIKDTLDSFNIANKVDLKPDQLNDTLKSIFLFIKEGSKDIKLLLIDNLFSKVEVNNGIDFFKKKIVDIIKKLGITVLVTVNNVKDVLLLADFALILSNGSQVQFGLLNKIYDEPISYQALCAMSIYGVNRISVVIRDRIIYPLNIESKSVLENGEYDFCFRSEEVKLEDKGIKAEVIDSFFIDGKKKLYEVYISVGESKERATLIINKDIETRNIFYFMPTRFYLYKK